MAAAGRAVLQGRHSRAAIAARTSKAARNRRRRRDDSISKSCTIPSCRTTKSAARLLALPGVGPYAAAHVMLTSLGRYSRLVLDSWTRPTYGKLSGARSALKDATIERRFKRYGEWAGLAFWLYLTRSWVEDGFACLVSCLVWSGWGRCPNWSSKPVRPCSPRLGRFDSCAAPLRPDPALSERTP